MPNPFARTQINTSKNQGTERPEPLTPVMERIHDENHPWRGTEDHGVDDVHDYVDPVTSTVDIDGRPTHIDYEPEPTIVEPVPVYLVQESSREYRQFWTDRFTTTDGRSSMLGRDNNRVTALVLNTEGAKTVWIASNPADLALRGYPLGPGKELRINGEMPVYAIASDGTNVTVGLYVETVVPERHA